MSKVALALSFAYGIFSFFGYLPLYKPFLVLIPRNIFLSFPKPWILLTSPFICDSLFGFILICFFFSQMSKVIEPLWGSKEFLRFVIIIGYMSSTLLTIFAYIVYLFTSTQGVIIRQYDPQQSIIAAFILVFAQLYGRIEVPLPCCQFKVKELPYTYLLVTLIILPFTDPNTLLSTIIGYITGFLYIKFMQPHQNMRGDPNFDIISLVPTCGCCSPDEEQAEFGHEEHQRPRGHGRTIADL